MCRQVLSRFFLFSVDIEYSSACFLSNLYVNLWDCGGQDAFMESYLSQYNSIIFTGVEVLVYVFDVESREIALDMNYYQSALENILKFSPSAKIFCFLHKMDLIPEDQRHADSSDRHRFLVYNSKPCKITFLSTSIWDETLYRAWSTIVQTLIPNINRLEYGLKDFARMIEAEEVILFERATFFGNLPSSRA